MFEELNTILKDGYSSFRLLNPSLPMAISSDIGKLLWKGLSFTRNVIDAYEQHQSIPEFLGKQLGGKIVGKIMQPISDALLHLYDNPISNTSHLDRGYSDLKVGRSKVVILFHDADKAGPHLDIHFENGTSFIRRVKPQYYKKLSYNTDGELTLASKALLISMLNKEIDNHSRIPQNIDHNWAEAFYMWNYRSESGIKDGEYGAGNTRQVILQSEVEIIKSNREGESTTFYFPALNGNKLMYIHNLYPGTDTKAPIAIWGSTVKKTPQLQDKLHLKLINDFDKFKEKVKDGEVTIKYDSASAILITDPDGSNIVSPRISRRTGERINYLGKVPEVGKIRSEEGWIVRGELLFKTKKGDYLSAAEAGGVLNSHSLRDPNLVPEIRVYRVERYAGKHLKEIKYGVNKALLVDFCKLNPTLFKVPETVDLSKFNGYSSLEGFVGVPKDESLDNGYKYKFFGDLNDWEITDVNLGEGPSGRTAGVVHFKSLDSGKEFKMGPGQLGNEEFVRDIMKHPRDYIGLVYKVKSRVGHEGRAAKLIEEHLDKGLAE